MDHGIIAQTTVYSQIYQLFEFKEAQKMDNNDEYKVIRYGRTNCRRGDRISCYRNGVCILID